jgi:hypothetical protein
MVEYGGGGSLGAMTMSSMSVNPSSRGSGLGLEAIRTARVAFVRRRSSACSSLLRFLPRFASTGIGEDGSSPSPVRSIASTSTTTRRCLPLVAYWDEGVMDTPDVALVGFSSRLLMNERWLALSLASSSRSRSLCDLLAAASEDPYCGSPANTSLGFPLPAVARRRLMYIDCRGSREDAGRKCSGNRRCKRWRGGRDGLIVYCGILQERGGL